MIFRGIRAKSAEIAMSHSKGARAYDPNPDEWAQFYSLPGSDDEGGGALEIHAGNTHGRSDKVLGGQNEQGPNGRVPNASSGGMDKVTSEGGENQTELTSTYIHTSGGSHSLRSGGSLEPSSLERRPMASAHTVEVSISGTGNAHTNESNTGSGEPGNHQHPGG